MSACVMLLFKSSSAWAPVTCDIQNHFMCSYNEKSVERPQHAYSVAYIWWWRFQTRARLLRAHRIYLREWAMSPAIMTLNAIDFVFRSHTIYFVSFFSSSVCRHKNDVKRVRDHFILFCFLLWSLWLSTANRNFLTWVRNLRTRELMNAVWMEGSMFSVINGHDE